MPVPYEVRTGGESGKIKKQSMAELKLRRLTELNQRLQEDLARRRIPVSEAALEYAVFLHLCFRAALTSPQPYRIHRQGAQGLYGALPVGNGASLRPSSLLAYR